MQGGLSTKVAFERSPQWRGGDPPRARRPLGQRSRSAEALGQEGWAETWAEGQWGPQHVAMWAALRPLVLSLDQWEPWRVP